MSENPRTFANFDDFLKNEYEFQEKTNFGERGGTSDTIIVNKAALSFKSYKEQVLASAQDTIDKVQQRFPYMNYVAVPVDKEVAGTKQIG